MTKKTSKAPPRPLLSLRSAKETERAPAREPVLSGPSYNAINLPANLPFTKLQTDTTIKLLQNLGYDPYLKLGQDQEADLLWQRTLHTYLTIMWSLLADTPGYAGEQDPQKLLADPRTKGVLLAATGPVILALRHSEDKKDPSEALSRALAIPYDKVPWLTIDWPSFWKAAPKIDWKALTQNLSFSFSLSTTKPQPYRVNWSEQKMFPGGASDSDAAKFWDPSPITNATLHDDGSTGHLTQGFTAGDWKTALSPKIDWNSVPWDVLPPGVIWPESGDTQDAFLAIYQASTCLPGFHKDDKGVCVADEVPKPDEVKVEPAEPPKEEPPKEEPPKEEPPKEEPPIQQKPPIQIMPPTGTIEPQTPPKESAPPPVQIGPVIVKPPVSFRPPPRPLPPPPSLPPPAVASCPPGAYWNPYSSRCELPEEPSSPPPEEPPVKRPPMPLDLPGEKSPTERVTEARVALEESKKKTMMWMGATVFWTVVTAGALVYASRKGKK